MSNEEIDKLCIKYEIRNYTINDGLVDVNGSVYLGNYKLTKLPLRFGKVSGEFECPSNKLTNLDGCPSEVGESFYCYQNQLTTLKGGPDKVGESFQCAKNLLTSLEGGPTSVGTFMHYDFNKIINIDHMPDNIGHGRDSGNVFYCMGNPFGSISSSSTNDFLSMFKTYKVLNDGQVNLKRLKYVMSVFNKSIFLDKIKKHYTIS